MGSTTIGRWRQIASAVTAAMTALVLGSAVAAATEFKIAHSADTGHPNHTALVAMAERVAARTKDAVTFKIFPNNELGSPPEQTEQLRLGVLDFAILSPSQLDKYDRAFGVVFIPYQFDDLAHAHRTLDTTAASWIEAHAQKIGVEHIANFEWGFRALTNSRRPVNTPADVKGMKLRVPPEIQIKAAMEALGAVTATIAFPEVYTALATHTVDGQDNPVAATYSNKFYEVQKYLALTRHVYTPMFLLANARVWKSLPEDERTIIAEEAKKAGDQARAEVAANEDKDIAAMEKAGIQTTRPDVAPFRAAMGPAYATIKSYVGPQAWDEWQGFVAAARTGG